MAKVCGEVRIQLHRISQTDVQMQFSKIRKSSFDSRLRGEFS